MAALKSVGRRISDLLAAAAFAEEGGADSARELLRERGERPAEEKKEARRSPERPGGPVESPA